MKTLAMILTLTGALFLTKPGNSQSNYETKDNYFQKEKIEKDIEKILGFDVSLNNSKRIICSPSSTGIIFDITSNKFNGEITFSKDYLERNLGGAKEDLLAMYKLKKDFSAIKYINLWNCGYEDPKRFIKVGGETIYLEEGWKNIIPADGIRINKELCGFYHGFFYLPYPSNEFDQRLVDYIKKIEQHPPEYCVEKLWGLDIDVFKIKDEPEWILKGRSSTIIYNPQTKEFFLGGMWEKNAKIEQIIPKSRMIVVNEGGTKWYLNFLHTEDNETCSAYRATN